MNKFEQDVIDRLARIEGHIEDVQGSLDRDYHILHGNGRPGLVDRVTALETNQKAKENHVGFFAGVIGFIVNAALALYAALKNQL